MARCIHKPGRFTVPDPACSQLAIGRPMPPWQPSLPGAWPIFLPPRCCLFACYSQTLLLSLIRLQSESCYLQLPMPKPRPHGLWHPNHPPKKKEFYIFIFLENDSLLNDVLKTKDIKRRRRRRRSYPCICNRSSFSFALGPQASTPCATGRQFNAQNPACSIASTVGNGMAFPAKSSIKLCVGRQSSS